MKFVHARFIEHDLDGMCHALDGLAGKDALAGIELVLAAAKYWGEPIGEEREACLRELYDRESGGVYRPLPFHQMQSLPVSHAFMCNKIDVSMAFCPEEAPAWVDAAREGAQMEKDRRQQRHAKEDALIREMRAGLKKMRAMVQERFGAARKK